MAVTHSSTIRNTLCDTNVDELDTGTANATGSLRFETSGGAEVATLLLSNPAAGTASGGTSIFNTISPDTDATGGTISQFHLRDRDNNTVNTGSVTITGGGGDIELTAVVVGAGSTVDVSQLTYSAPA